MKNPCFGVKLPKKAEKNVKSIQALSKEQIKLYCEHATERYGNGKCVYRLGYGLVLILFTGLRLGEAAGLMRDDIDFQKRTLKVQRTLEYVKTGTATKTATNVLVGCWAIILPMFFCIQLSKALALMRYFPPSFIAGNPGTCINS